MVTCFIKVSLEITWKLNGPLVMKVSFKVQVRSPILGPFN